MHVHITYYLYVYIRKTGPTYLEIDEVITYGRLLLMGTLSIIEKIIIHKFEHMYQV